MPTLESFGPEYQILLKVIAGMLLGALLGLEREIAEKPAGLRTHMLVSGTATLLVALSNVVVARFTVDLSGDLVRADPIRIIEAIITGISFLGAGTIIRRGADEGYVEGLTTAASVLFVAGIGITVGLDQWIVAVGLTLIALLVLGGLRYIERRLGLHDDEPGEE